MGTFVAFDPAAHMHGGTVLVPTTRRPQRPQNLAVYSLSPLPTDSIGTMTATFDGVHAGSEIRVYLPDGTEVAGIESCADDQVLSWDAYADGSANNNVTIRIVNNAYKVREIAYTTRTGAQSISIQQDADRVYLNP